MNSPLAQLLCAVSQHKSVIFFDPHYLAQAYFAPGHFDHTTFLLHAASRPITHHTWSRSHIPLSSTDHATRKPSDSEPPHHFRFLTALVPPRARERMVQPGGWDEGKRKGGTSRVSGLILGRPHLSRCIMRAAERSCTRRMEYGSTMWVEGRAMWIKAWMMEIGDGDTSSPLHELGLRHD
jgi:hypothetical protein